jgi:hypothetical protein
MAALVLTSLARARIGRRAWRAVHWLAYALWPLSLAHGLGSSGDLRSGPLLWLSAACATAVAAALAVRALAWANQVPAARRPAAELARQEAAARQQAAAAARHEDLLAHRQAVLGGQDAALARHHAALATRTALAAREAGR